MSSIFRASLPGLPLFTQKLQLANRDANQALIRGLCSTAYLGNQSALCRVLGRYKMFVDTADIAVSSHLMLDGYWEMWLTEALASVLKPGMVAVDIGANLGYFTMLMADHVGPTGAVHAFEPNPPIADRLAKSIDVNGFLQWVKLYRDPLGDQDGLEVFLSVPEGDPKNAHLVPDANAAGAIKLNARRFDSDSNLLRADVIKIDAEGAELNIWHGMSALFEQSAKPLTIFLEFAAIRYANPCAFLDEIKGYGFSLGVVSLESGVCSRTVEQILAAPGTIDQMLMLQR